MAFLVDISTTITSKVVIFDELIHQFLVLYSLIGEYTKVVNNNRNILFSFVAAVQNNTGAFIIQ